MVRDAESHASEDKKRRETIDAKNQAEHLAYEVEKSLKEFGDKVDSGERSKVEEAVTKLRSAAESEDAEAIKRATDELNQVWQKVAAAMYQQSGQQAGPEGAPQGEPSGAGASTGAGAGAGGGSGAVDADFEVVDEDKKS